MVKAYVYARVSSTRQLFGSSLQRQRRRAEEFARLHGLEIDESFDQRDAGVSAYTGEHIDRGTLGGFLASIRQKQIERGSYLLIESLDRLSRLHPREALDDFLEILASGVSIAVLSENRIFHPGSPDGQELLELVRGMAHAHDESRLRSERTSKGWEHKLSKIDRMILTSRAPGWLAPRADRSTFDLIEDRALIVRSIFDLVRKEGLGAEAIASELNRRRLKPFSGSTNGWRKCSVHSILKNRAVIGEFQPHVVRGGIRRPVGNAHKGYFPAVIGETEFNAVQSLRAKRRVGSGGRLGSGVRNLFKRIARCGYCGGKMHFGHTGAKVGGGFLVCDRGRRGLACSTVRWPYDQFETTFLAFVPEMNAGAVFNELVHTDDLTSLSAELDNAKARLAGLNSRRDRISNQFTGVQTTDFLRQLFTDVDIEFAAIQRRIDEAQERLRMLIPEVPTVRRLPEWEASFAQSGGSGFERALRNRLRSAISDLAEGVYLLAAGQNGPNWPDDPFGVGFPGNEKLPDHAELSGLLRRNVAFVGGSSPRKRRFTVHYRDGRFRTVSVGFDG